jgi:hypothetical protein
LKTTWLCSTEPDHIATTGIYPVVRVGCRLGAMDSGITNGVSKWAIDFQAYSCIFPSIADRLYCFNPDLFLFSKKIWSNQSCWSNPDSSWWKLWKTCRPCILCKLDGAILALTNYDQLLSANLFGSLCYQSLQYCPTVLVGILCIVGITVLLNSCRCDLPIFIDYVHVLLHWLA